MPNEDGFVMKGKIVLEGIEGGGTSGGSPVGGGRPAPTPQPREEPSAERAGGHRAPKSVGAREILDRQSLDESALSKKLSGSLQNIQRNQFVSGLGSLIKSPGAAAAGSGLTGIAAGGLTSLIPAITTAMGGPIAGVIGKAMTGPLNAFVQRFFSEKKAVEQSAGQAVQAAARGYSSRGIKLEGSEIEYLFEFEREKAQRNIDTMKQVSRIQDRTSGTIEGMISGTYRRTLDALIG